MIHSWCTTPLSIMPEVISSNEMTMSSQDDHQPPEVGAMSETAAPGSDEESDSSDNTDNDAVLITRSAEADSSENNKDDNEDRTILTKKPVNNPSDSGSEIEDDSRQNHDHNLTSPGKTHSASVSSDEGISKSVVSKSRIRKLDSDSDSDSYQTSDMKPATKRPSDNNYDSQDKHNLTPSVTRSSSDSSSDKAMTKGVPSKSRNLDSDSDSDDQARPCDNPRSKTDKKKSTLKVVSRIKPTSSPSSDSSEPEPTVTSKYEEQKMRMKEKRNKMQQKFKSLITSRAKETEQIDRNGDEKDSNSEGGIGKEVEPANSSDDEAASIERIKQKIKDRTNHLKSTIYDPDTSSEEERRAPKHVLRQKKRTKSTKPTSPKPLPMSAKQAMENMQKIKSESNRMLREKEVSLPYHRSKALSLKDIMSRRRTAVTADGKALPLKMNKEQLKQYALMLEERQKEMMELCKSDTEDENEEPNIENKEIMLGTDNTESKLVTDDIESNLCTDNIENKTNSVDVDMTSQNDTLYDTLAQEHSESILNADFDDNVLSKMDTFEVPNLTSNDVTDDVDIKDEIASTNKDESVKNTSSNNEDICLDNDRKNIEANKENEIDTEMHLVYNDSIEETNKARDKPSVEEKEIVEDSDPNKVGTELDSQLISLHYDTENTFNLKVNQDSVSANQTENLESHQDIESAKQDTADPKDLDINTEDQGINANLDNFSDDDINMADIDKIIEDAEILGQNNTDNYDSPMLLKDPNSKVKPKLTGAPGMIIDLDGTDATARKKLTGVELLKERFTYFAKLKTPEEMEREREKRIKPGMQHLKLKQELENEIAEQRSLEWAKRLEDEKQLHQEMTLEKEEGSDADDIDKIDAKIEESEAKESSGESEPEENDCDITDKPVKRNPMIADEAEESDDAAEEATHEVNDDNDGGQDADDDGDDEESNDETSEEESEDEQPTTKKGRILKAFEDSDDETEKQEPFAGEANNVGVENTDDQTIQEKAHVKTGLKDTQDDDLQLAQQLNTQSEDLFASQESSLSEKKTTASSVQSDDKVLGTQTFSITNLITRDFNLTEKLAADMQSQCYSQEGDLDAVVGMCSGSFSQSQAIPTQQTSQLPTSQVIGEDILALCTGKFYDGPFVSQLENEQLGNNTSQVNNATNGLVKLLDKDAIESQNNEKNVLQNDVFSKGKESNAETENVSNLNGTNGEEDKSQNNEILTDLIDTHPMSESIIDNVINSTEIEKPKDDLLESILDELKEPDVREPNKYFVGNRDNKENKQSDANAQFKKKFIIDSDDEENGERTKEIKTKKPKRNLEKRALQISDDESDQSNGEELDGEEYASDLEDDEGRVVEYDSEENEVEIKPQNPRPKKQKAPDFFEQEAELTSEDEWIGSGDEDEAGLDRMEHEAGDDDTFNQTKLQRKLGQIHMRDVLDQDKREVRIIQELLFEDGDLGAGSRQRKFRWKNADGVEESGTTVEDLPDTQEQEFESEEQWRKQRYERELFLREMQKQNETEGIVDIRVDTKSTINVSKSMAPYQEIDTSVTTTEVVEKKTTKEVPSPKKTAFTLFKQSYHGSLLTRGQGALARLAALATPLAIDDDGPTKGALANSGKRNFVFATITPEDTEPKVTKRKAETNTGTPRLVKKMRTEDKPKHSKSSLLDHMKV